jgi:hypothetical protein
MNCTGTAAESCAVGKKNNEREILMIISAFELLFRIDSSSIRSGIFLPTSTGNIAYKLRLLETLCYCSTGRVAENENEESLRKTKSRLRKGGPHKMCDGVG